MTAAGRNAGRSALFCWPITNGGNRNLFVLNTMQTPTKYVHKHFKPAEFSTGACVLKKEVTKASEKVLYRYACELQAGHAWKCFWRGYVCCQAIARSFLFLGEKPRALQ